MISEAELALWKERLGMLSQETELRLIREVEELKAMWAHDKANLTSLDEAHAAMIAEREELRRAKLLAVSVIRSYEKEIEELRAALREIRKSISEMLPWEQELITAYGINQLIAIEEIVSAALGDDHA